MHKIMMTSLQKMLWLLLLLPCFLAAQNETFYTLKSYNHVNDLAIDAENIWAATTNGLVQRNKATGEICAIYNSTNSPLTEENVTEVALSPDGDVLVGTYDGRLHTLVFGEWYLLDSLEHEVSGTAFYQNEERISTFFNERDNLCRLNKDGSYSLFETADGKVYRTYLNTYCQAFPCCCAQKAYSFETWNGTNWDTLKIGNREELAIDDFVVTPDNVLWAIYDSTLYQYNILSNEIQLDNSQNPNIGALQSISLASDGALWLIAEEGVFTVENNIITPKNEGLNQLPLTDIHFDENGKPYTNGRYGLFEMENDVWIPHFYGLLNDENATGIFTKNGDAWFPENHGMSLFNGETIENFTYNNSVLTAGTNEIIHADSQSGIWLNKLNLDNEFQLFNYNGNDWVEITTANSGLTSFQFDTIISDNLGNVWFKYSDGNNAAARFDFQNWTNFSTLDEYTVTNFPPKLWTYSEALSGMIKNENGVITEFPINVGPTDLNLTETAFTQAGHAWVVHEDEVTLQNSLLYFNGDIWEYTEPFLFDEFNESSLEIVETIFAKENRAWFFNEIQSPAPSYDYYNFYESKTYRFTGNTHSIIPYSISCNQNFGYANAALTVLDVEEMEDNFWVVYDLSRVYTQIIFDACGLGCAANVLVKVDEQTGFGGFPVAYEQEIDKELGRIRHLQKDLQGNLWLFHDDKITTFKELPPLLETFSKPAFCNEGQVLACVTSGGLAPFNYQWNDGTTNPLNAPISEGTFSVTLTDANNYQETGIEEIEGNANPMTLQSTIQSPACDDSGQIDIQVNGGSAPYEFLWEDGTMMATYESLMAGVYELTVTDAEGCTTKEIFELQDPPPILIEEDKERVSCVGSQDGQIEIEASGGIAPYVYEWNNGAASAIIQNLNGGTYTVTVTDAVGCTEEKQIFVNEANTPLDATAVIQHAGCVGDENGAIDLTATGGIGSKKYQWSNGATTADIDDLVAGMYELTLTDGSGFGNFCTEIFTFEILGATSPLQVDVANFEPIACAGEESGSIEIIVANGIEPYEYLWSGGQNTAELSNVGAGVYELTVTDALGCTLTESYTFNEPQPLLIPDAVNDISCFGNIDGEIAPDVAGGVLPLQFMWSTGETESSINNLTEGAYAVTITDAFGCTATQDFFITEPDELALSLITEDSDVGQGNGSANATISGGTPPFDYLWNTGATTPILDNLSGGFYSVTITDNADCSVEKMFNIFDVADDYDIEIFSKTSGQFGKNAATHLEEKQKAIFSENNATISIYPNPFAEAFFIDLKNEKSVLSNLEVYTVFGQKMELQITENLLKNQVKIATTGWSSGAYFVHFSINDSYYKHKLIKY